MDVLHYTLLNFLSHFNLSVILHRYIMNYNKFEKRYIKERLGYIFRHQPIVFNGCSEHSLTPK